MHEEGRLERAVLGDAEQVALVVVGARVVGEQRRDARRAVRVVLERLLDLVLRRGARRSARAAACRWQCASFLLSKV